MNYHHRYRSKQVIHFTRWSNTSYAVFNSIGKVVLIGRLSNIMSGVATVKSTVSKSLAYLIETFYLEKESLAEHLEHIAVDESLVSEGAFLCDMCSVVSPREASVSGIRIIRNQQKYTKASEGLFSFVELAFIWLIRHFFYKDENFKANFA